MNILQTWNYFYNPDNVFLKSSIKLNNAPSKLTILDERRKNVQKEIIALVRETDICRTCQNTCCGGNYNHFTMVDFIVRMFSDKPIREFGLSTRPPSLLSSLFMKYGIKRLGKNHPHIKASVTKCPNLTITGCEFLPEDKPIRCVLYTCKDFRQSLPPEVLLKMGVLTKELTSISVQTLRLFS